eukprot:CAMPEP_0174702818 /NCGR_PEP_ID=MMETSP1094-20130205/6977_1 /TAXON_ID=156173 /ORGANISM="Chrysochromulina brevifilum, Strain UTEX LB 985" /LENGTH=50 /DNA_ID=CAMNT_0015900649 /DNA_START=548 /DNA_END=700 /DNA_ORIENTATION=-
MAKTRDRRLARHIKPVQLQPGAAVPEQEGYSPSLERHPLSANAPTSTFSF